MSGSQTAFALGYQISPILLIGGIAQAIPGQTLPIISITEGVSFLGGLLSGSLPSSTDDFFAQFTVIPGSRLIDQQIGHYPFANQSIAANAVIAQPLKVAVRMDCPANGQGAYLTKLATFMALQAALQAHNASGGLYTVVTPACIYANCVMESLVDISGAGSNQVQYQYQFNFEQPLVTLQAAAQAGSSLINAITSGTQLSSTPSWSGLLTSAASSVGNAASSVVSGAKGLLGSLTGSSPGITS